MPVIESPLPFRLTGIDSDNGGEFINEALIAWAWERNLFFTRSRPYRSNDKATSSRRTETWYAATRSTTVTIPRLSYGC
ncbi:hypothetical protein GCM10027416_03660 [Okibacterium endophyticum]